MKISVQGVSDVDRAIRELKAYKKLLNDKMHELIDRLAQEGIQVADAGYRVAQYDGPSDLEVGTVIWESDNSAYITAYGDKILFIEFGTGQAYEEHPLGAQFGFVHGHYGFGRGNINRYPKGWVYVGPMGLNPTPYAHHPRSRTTGNVLTDKVRTKGNPPARAMYDAGRYMHRMVEATAKEVFG